MGVGGTTGGGNLRFCTSRRRRGVVVAASMACSGQAMVVVPTACYEGRLRTIHAGLSSTRATAHHRALATPFAGDEETSGHSKAPQPCGTVLATVAARRESPICEL